MTMISILFHSEVKKALGFAQLRFFFVSMVIVIAAFGVFLFHEPTIESLNKTAEDTNIFHGFFMGHFLFLSAFASIGLNLLVVSLFSIEDQGRFQKLLAFPIHADCLLVSKLILVLLIDVLLTFSAAIIISFEALLLSFFRPDHADSLVSSFPLMILFMVRFTLLAFCVSIFHFVLHLFVTNSSAMILLSVALPIISFFEFFHYLPYGWPMLRFFKDLKYRYDFDSWPPLLSAMDVACISIALVTVLLFYLSRRFTAHLRIFR
jgi:hypothetical protein